MEGFLEEAGSSVQVEVNVLDLPKLGKLSRKTTKIDCPQINTVLLVFRIGTGMSVL